MGRDCAIACTCAFLLVFACTSSEGSIPGPDMSQKEVDFMDGPDMSQKEVDFMDLLDPDDFIEQREVTMEPLPIDLIRSLKKTERSRAADTGVPQIHVTLGLDEGFTPRGRPMFRPRSSGPKISFPPGQPSPDNLQALCAQHLRYPTSSLPQSGFGHLHRQADAINRLESRYGMCCQGNGTQDHEVTLCCVRQAWEHTLKQFCEDEFSVKTRHYHCCKKKDGARQRCFQGEAPNPAYLPTDQDMEPLPASETGFTSTTPALSVPFPSFTFNPDTCQRKRKPVPSSRDADINFPPGRPTDANIELVCRFRKLRPLYLLKCLPRKGYGWLARQSKAINRLERGFKHCCKGHGEVLNCANEKWREVMDRFCEDGGKSPRFPCCEMAAGETRYDCFSARAPHPGYDRELLSPSTTPEDPTLGQICETHKIIKKRKFKVGVPVQSLVSQCCPLLADQRTTCVQEKIPTLSERLCLGTKPKPPHIRRCCASSSQDSPNCFSSLLIDAITKATKTPRVRKRTCPLS